MPTKKELKETLDALNNGQFHIECPSCDEEIKLSEAGLFHLDNFTPESLDIYKRMVVEQKERRASLKERKLNIPIKSEVGAKAINLGFLLERLAPTLDGFTFNKNDCRSMFDPIDYVIFEGLSEKQKVDNIIFVDIKSGGARLTQKQKKIKQVVKDKKVVFKTYKP
jgi:predicted Holliday junction resolvase-like endonuclease|tara:strand:- start:146 stop:643 length:498 start_codon:yes stop_codon:yes gene_type:complete